MSGETNNSTINTWECPLNLKQRANTILLLLKYTTIDQRTRFVSSRKRRQPVISRNKAGRIKPTLAYVASWITLIGSFLSRSIGLTALFSNHFTKNNIASQCHAGITTTTFLWIKKI